MGQSILRITRGGGRSPLQNDKRSHVDRTVRGDDVSGIAFRCRSRLSSVEEGWSNGDGEQDGVVEAGGQMEFHGCGMVELFVELLLLFRDVQDVLVSMLIKKDFQQ